MYKNYILAVGRLAKTNKFAFFLLNFCSRKQKYLEKRSDSKGSNYSVILRDISDQF